MPDTFKSVNLFHSLILQEFEILATDKFLKEETLMILKLYQELNALTDELVVADALK